MEERTTKFCVGDKVICGGRVGIITSITPKRKDIKVDFGGYTSVFGADGWTHGDVWNMQHIVRWTPEGQKKIDDALAIRRCRDLFDKASMKKTLTPDMARDIIKILVRKEEE